MFTKTASVDLRRGQYIAYSSSLTVDGFLADNGAFEILDEPSNVELGAATERMLAASTLGMPTPGRDDSPFGPVLDRLGLRSYGRYMKGTKHVGVTREGTVVVVTPSRNGGSREGFVGMPDEAQQWENPSPEELGRAVLAALEQATA